MRFLFTLWLARATVFAMKLMGKRGSYLPGKLAIQLYPDFLSGFNPPKEIIGITGTNGKTTLTNLLGDFFKSQNLEYFSNSYGSNTVEGIAACYIHNSNFFGKLYYERAVLEIDERSALKIFKHVHPDWLVVTNLFRDSFPRNAHSDYIFDILEEAIPTKTRLILNSDDLISSFLKEKEENLRSFFSMDLLPEEEEVESRVRDISNCPRCDYPLAKEFIRYNHIGRYHCDNCAFENFKAEIRLIAASQDKITLALDGKEVDFPTVSDNPVDNYNLLAAISLLFKQGYDLNKMASAFEQIRVVKSRYDKENIGPYRLYRIMAKSMNPISSSRVFNYIQSLEGDIAIVFANPTLLFGNRNSEQMAWLYDLDFKFLAGDNIKQFILCGKRYKDYEVALNMYDIDSEKIYAVSSFNDAAAAVDYKLVNTVVVLNDTDTIEKAEKVRVEIAQRMKEEVS